MKKCSCCKLDKEYDQYSKKSNKCKSCISEYQKLYRIKNKEKSKEYQKEYYLNNSESIKKKSKEYSINNPEKVKLYKNKYASENSELIKEKSKKYWVENMDTLKEKSSKYRKINADKIRKRRRDNNKIVNMMNTKYSKKRRQIDPVYKITSNIRVLIRNSIKSKGFKKKSKSLSILGCNFEFFKEYLESKFEPWMTWDNYGIFISGEINSGWDIDHIIPISVAKSEDEVIKLNHYTNLQPLCSYINRYIKKDKLEFNINEIY